MSLKKYLPTTPGRNDLIDLYRELSDLTFKGEHRLAFAWVRDSFQLGYDKLTTDALTLFFGELAKVSRFNGSDHIAASRRGSVMQHTLMCTPVLGLLAEEATERLGTAGQTKHAVRVATMRRDQIEQVLVHDGGELLVEFSSLSQRWKSGNAEETVDKAKVERGITEFGLRLAFQVASTYRSPTKQESEFARIIGGLRAELLSEEPLDPRMTQGSLEGRADYLMRRTQRELDIHHLTPQALQAVGHFMRAYDEPEGHSQWARFNGQLVKRAENIQSNLHFLEHSGKDGTPNWLLAPSVDIIAGLKYSEREMDKLFAAIRPGDAVEVAFARAAARMAYEMNLALVQNGIPRFIDREAMLRKNLPANPSEDQMMRAESLVTSPELRQQEILRAGERHMGSEKIPSLNFSRPELSAKQLEWLYCGAMQWAREDIGFAPPAQALLLLREHPPQLRQYIKDSSPYTSEGTPELVQALVRGRDKKIQRPSAA
jgi:hypothetical protein